MLVRGLGVLQDYVISRIPHFYVYGFYIGVRLSALCAGRA
jgi:hypothetical protein